MQRIHTEHIFHFDLTHLVSTRTEVTPQTVDTSRRSTQPRTCTCSGYCHVVSAAQYGENLVDTSGTL